MSCLIFFFWGVGGGVMILYALAVTFRSHLIYAPHHMDPTYNSWSKLTKHVTLMAYPVNISKSTYCFPPTNCILVMAIRSPLSLVLKQVSGIPTGSGHGHTTTARRLSLFSRTDEFRIQVRLYRTHFLWQQVAT